MLWGGFCVVPQVAVSTPLAVINSPSPDPLVGGFSFRVFVLGLVFVGQPGTRLFRGAFLGAARPKPSAGESFPCTHILDGALYSFAQLPNETCVDQHELVRRWDAFEKRLSNVGRGLAPAALYV